MQLPSISTAIQVRRLSWYAKMSEYNHEQAVVLTAMFGQIPFEAEPTIGPDMLLAPKANPWALQFYTDMDQLQHIESAHDLSGETQGEVIFIFTNEQIAKKVQAHGFLNIAS